jgi:hypothetical protein
MSHNQEVQNMMRSFQRIDRKQELKLMINPSEQDYCLMIDGKSDGYIYHHSTLVEMINNGFVLNSNEKFKRMTTLTLEEFEYFHSNQKI